ncbi:MAG: right-handed parallel beta-helix repeat-containing protein [Rhodospirillales bacterium]|nr:right-handed parallel beta-helix repeat-containing protein [Alphaproteobacteria bacterium]USO05139.1 MAG: right-handed parallel beta-helix repeat-containing protein [Rhodospirillales bacterium]
MSTYKARKEAADHFGISTHKLLATTALVAAVVLPGAAHAGTLEANETWQFEAGTDVNSATTSLGHVRFDHTGNNRIIGNLVKEDICATCSVDINSALTVATGVESGPMQLLGRLTSNGEVKILDVNGFLFGKNSVVDTQGFAAIGGALKNAGSFLADGKMDIDVAEDASIVIEQGAMISVADAGLAAFVAPHISNSGIINAKMGTVALTAGETITLDLYGDGLVEVAVEGELADALIENSGKITAEGGRVQMTALAAKGAVDNIINTSGIITVASAEVVGGKIVLSGGNKGVVSVSGIADASGTDGGSIEVTGENVHVTDTATLSVDGGRGVDQQGDGGSALIYGDKLAVLEGRISGRGGAVGGDGGKAELSAGGSVGFNGLVDLGASNGEVGTFVIDPAHLFINDTYSFFGFDISPVGTLTVYDQAIANVLANNNVKLWATQTANTGSNIDISAYSYDVLVTPGYIDTSGPWWTWNWVPAVYATVSGITSNDLTIAAPEVNIGHDVTLGNGALNVTDILTGDSVLGFGLISPWTDIIVETLNLNGKIYKRTALVDPSFATLANDAQINTTANTINVLSNNALIQQGIHFADIGATVNVHAGTYAENLTINVEDLKLTGTDDPVLQAADDNEPLVTVLSSGVNIDPIVFDGGGTTAYGVYAAGAGANGLVVDGNTFHNFTEAGVYVANATGGTSTIENNTFEGTSTRGVEIGGLSNGSSVFVQNNNMGLVDGRVVNGVVVSGDLTTNARAIVQVNDIASIGNGVDFQGAINTALAEVLSNMSIDAYGHGVNFGGNLTNASVIVNKNNSIVAGNNGIVFAGSVTGGYVQVSGNNHGIHADNHGIVFNADVEDNAKINIHDNVIAANEDGGSVGDGIRFEGKIKASEVNIGDGKGPDYYDDPSNIIKGVDGIHFVGDIEDGAEINMDGNRLGYYKKYNGQHISAELKDDGIEFDGKIEDDSEVKITDNRINAGDDGIKFNGKVTDDARIIIGGYRDGNAIFADGDGIQFGNDIEKHSLLEISYNDVDAEENGIEFNGETSNHIHAVHNEEILIIKNTIEGDQHGIIFYGKADNSRHDIVIRDNYAIKGRGGNGITHVGNIDDAELLIRDNNEIYGKKYGIHIVGAFYNDAKIHIHGNEDVRGRDDDGIHVEDNGWSDEGAEVDVDYNHVHWSGDDGIFVKNIENAQIHDNTVHDVDGNGIYGSNIDGGDILSNTIWNTDENGILVNPTDYIDIAHNDIHDAENDGIHVEDGKYADIWDNHIGRTGDDGIHVENNRGVEIWDNYIHNTGEDSDHGDGIYVKESDHAKIKKNKITGAGRDGINVKRSDNVLIGWNDIFAQGGSWWYYNADYGQQGAGRDGIHVENSDDLLVIGNDITADLGYGKYPIDQMAAGRHGIYVEGGKDIFIKYNDVLGDSSWSYYGGYKSVDSVGEDGIHVEGSEDIFIGWNDVSSAGDDGIQVIVKDNDEHDKKDHGHHDDVNKIIIVGNDVEKSGDDGIVVNTEEKENRREEEVFRVSVIPQQKPSYDDNGKKLYIKIADNEVIKSGDEGIEVNLKRDGNKGNEFFSFEHHDNHIEILNNKVSFSGDNGILVKLAPEKSHHHDDNQIMSLNSLYPYNDDDEAQTIQNYIKIDGNRVAFSGDDGIQVDVKTKTEGGLQSQLPPRFGISKFGGFGHGDETTNTIIISDNKVVFSGDDGIDVDVEAKGGDRRSQNTRFYDDNNGTTSNFITILGNNVSFSRDDGIVVDVDNPQGKGIFPGSIYDTVSAKGFGGSFDGNQNFVNISFNEVEYSGDDGIEVESHKDTMVNLLAVKNHVKASRDNGILLITKGGYFGGYGGPQEKGSQDEIVLTQSFRGFGSGFHHSKGGMNSLLIGNVVENSGSNGLYVKGQKHKSVTLKGNTFIDNPTGALFESGNVDVSDLERPNSFIVTEDFDPEGPVIGMKFDGSPWKLKIIGETLGSTIFDGYLSRPVGQSYYVYFTDGSILNPFTLEPIIIDGTQVNWDGIIPTNFGNVLPASVLKAIENRLWDADDPLLNGRGQIFVARVIPNNRTIDNIEDFFNNFGPRGRGFRGLSLTLTGLPPVNGTTSVAGISPAAGDEEDEDVAGIEPAAGEDVAGIEPAAGGEEAACWGDALNAAINGSVNYSYSGDPSESLSDAVNCGSQNL